MKKIILLFLVTCILKISIAQVEGVLVYQNDYDDKLGTGKVTTTIYESKSLVRLESTNVQTKSAFGPPSTKDQNVIIFDTDKLTETHLNADRKMAITTAFMVTITDERLKAIGTELTIQNLGQEKVGSYNCTHFVLVSSNPKYKTPPAKKDIWVTKDLGSGDIFYVGQYLYYPKGSSAAKKLMEAGADGVIVKWQIMDPVSKQPNICTLVSYQKKSLPASTFQSPPGYQAIQH
jgi:hypothetical protein